MESRYSIKQLAEKSAINPLMAIARLYGFSCGREDFSLPLSDLNDPRQYFCFLIADLLNDEMPIAFILFENCQTENTGMKLAEKDIYISQIAVMPAHRRLYLGTTLIDEAKKELYRHAEKEQLAIDIHERDSPTRQFLTANHFKGRGIIRGLFDDGDAYRFVYKKEAGPEKGIYPKTSVKRPIPKSLTVTREPEDQLLLCAR